MPRDLASLINEYDTPPMRIRAAHTSTTLLALRVSLLLALMLGAPPARAGTSQSSIQDAATDSDQRVELPAIRWTRGAGLLRFVITPHPDSHFAGGVPLEVRVRTGDALDLSWREHPTAKDARARIALPLGRSERPSARHVAVSGAVCNVDGSLCQPFLAQTELLLPGPWGGKLVAELGAISPTPRPRPMPTPPRFDVGRGEEQGDRWLQLRESGQWAVAVEQATRDDALILVEFSTKWCPGCVRLRGEFLDERVYGPLLQRFVRVSADADHPSSFHLKDRYQVGGYPTLLVLDATGDLRDRIVGFTTPAGLEARLEAQAPSARPQNEGVRTALLDLRGMAARGEWQPGWLRIQGMMGSRVGDETLRAEVLSLAVDFAEQVASDQVANLAQRAAEIAPRPGLAAALIDRAARHLRKSGQAQQATALEVQFTERLGAAIGARHSSSLQVSPDRAQLSGSVDAAGFGTQHDLANALWYLGSWSTDAFAEGLFAEAALRSAAQILDGQVAQTPATDTGQTDVSISLPTDLISEHTKGRMISQQGPVHDLISSLSAAGLIQVALPICVHMTQALPAEFTWHYKLADLLREADEPDAAVTAARQALHFSYGDNRLRATRRLAILLAEIGRADEAKQLVDDQLAAPVPNELDVRTHRYRRALQELLQTWLDEQRGDPR